MHRTLTFLFTPVPLKPVVQRMLKYEPLDRSQDSIRSLRVLPSGETINCELVKTALLPTRDDADDAEPRSQNRRGKEDVIEQHEEIDVRQSVSTDS